jgi:alpha-L-fucosidase
MKSFLPAILLVLTFSSAAQKTIRPTKAQLDWHETEFYIFMHFGPNTFTGKEWGEGNENEKIFNPGQLDCRQWCRLAKQAGAKGIIITAKHHDGFCLWPSKFSAHTVRESDWRNGKGDVLKELSQACREYGLKFGVYLSPWDRNHPDYGTEKYNSVFTGMLKEVLQNYGTVWELWWDGANGEGPNGRKQVYDWRKFENTVRQVSPKTVIFSDIGPDIRWTGNENGIAGNPNWNFLDTAGYRRGEGAPPPDTLNNGNYSGMHWIPAECDVSIRPGWFWRASENDKLKTPQELFAIYLKSVGRGANLLLNVPPDDRGLISDVDSMDLIAFKKLRDDNFSENLLKDANTYYQFSRKELPTGSLTIKSLDTASQAYTVNLQNFIVEMPRLTKLNCIVLREAIHNGQTIRKFRVVLNNGKKAVREIRGTSVGRKRILTFPATTVRSFTVYLEDAMGMDNIIGVSAYLIDEKLVEN